jgi:hypothetical protein
VWDEKAVVRTGERVVCARGCGDHLAYPFGIEVAEVVEEAQVLCVVPGALDHARHGAPNLPRHAFGEPLIFSSTEICQLGRLACFQKKSAVHERREEMRRTCFEVPPSTIILVSFSPSARTCRRKFTETNSLRERHKEGREDIDRKIRTRGNLSVI